MRILGISIIALFSIGLFVSIARDEDPLVAAATIFGATVLAGILSLAIKWVVEG